MANYGDLIFENMVNKLYSRYTSAIRSKISIKFVAFSYKTRDMIVDFHHFISFSNDINRIPDSFRTQSSILFKAT